MDNQVTLSDLNAFFRRRYKAFLLTFTFILIVTILIAFSLPSIYRSQATILIEEQQIPEEFVQSTITTYAEERLKMITELVMSREKLLEIIDFYNLYSDLRKKKTTSEIIRKMRADVGLETTDANVTNRRTGKSIAVTIAFTLSYEGKNPETVQKVTNQLASLYLEEDIRNRERMSSTTTVFLEGELETLKTAIQKHEIRISEFKEKHLSELPEFVSTNLSNIARLERDLDRVNNQIRSLEENRINLYAQLSEVEPLSPVSIGGEKVSSSPKERLKKLWIELTTLQTKFSNKHPDIRRLKREIKELEGQIGNLKGNETRIRELEMLKARLSDLDGKLGKQHPDVIQLKKQIEALSLEIEETGSEKSTKLLDYKPDNPVYINLMTQIASTESELKNLMEDREKIQTQLADYRTRIENAPLVEKEYSELTRDYDNTKRKYSEIFNKLMTAKVAKGMEESQQGERFLIKSKAFLPEKPYKPNRMAIYILGIIIGSALGVSSSFILEYLDETIKTTDELSRIVSAPVFSIIPIIETRYDLQKKYIKKSLYLLGFCGSIIGLAILWDSHVVPLTIVWSKLNNKLVEVGIPFLDYIDMSKSANLK